MIPRHEYKDQYSKAIAIAKDLYEYAKILDTPEEILEYQLTIVKLLTNCNVRIHNTWSKRINNLRSIMSDIHFEEKMTPRIRNGMKRFRNYERKRLNDKVQHFYRSSEILD